MPKKQSIFRQPNAQHFQLVHRSQRDPLVHDADAPQRLFKEVGRLNDKQKTGQTLADLERSLQSSSTSKSLKNPPLRPNEGEATLYGVYYDDTEYDYMQHLRGMEVDAERDPKADEAVFVSAPRGGSTAIGNRGAGGRRDVKNPKGATDEFESMFKKGQMVRMSEEEQQASSSSSSSKPSLPSTVLPSSTELSYQKAIESTRAIPTELTGFRPDMDPHLRQVLEALEDDAFVEVDDEDELFGGSGGAKGEDWIGELLGGGERGEDEGDLEDDFEFREEGIEDDGRPSWIAPHLRQQGDEDEEDDEDKPEETWQDRFQAFKASGGLARPSSPPPQAAAGGLDGEEQDEDAGSERADTLASLRSFAPTVNGAKNRRRKGGSRAGGSQASGYSMSSSSMFRNKGLTVLDERFEKIERDYEDEGDFDDDDFPSSEWMSEAGGEGEGMDDDNASVASFATATTFTRMLRKQQAAQSNEDTKEVSREDFEAIMDDFLDNYEVVGKKMVQVLPGRDGAEKLDSMRKALVGLDLEGNGPVGGSGGVEDEDEEGNLAGGTKRESDYIRQRYLREDYYSKRGEEEEKMPMLHIVGQGKEDKWDAETILSTYSNLENHPRMIGVAKREKKKGSSSASTATTSTTSNIPTSIASSSSSAPSEVDEEAEPSLDDFASSRGGDDVDSDAETVSSDGTVRAEPRAPPVRPRGESTEDKKARKLAVKAERSARRVEKKTRQETFGMERKTQLKGHERAVGSGRASDLTALASGGTGTVNVVRL